MKTQSWSHELCCLIKSIIIFRNLNNLISSYNFKRAEIHFGGHDLWPILPMIISHWMFSILRALWRLRVHCPCWRMPFL